MSGCRWLLQLVDRLEDLVDADVRGAGEDALELDRALFVDDEDGPARGARLLVEDPVELGHLTVGVEVAQDRVRDVAQGDREGGLCRAGVIANTQYLGISLLELRVRGPKRGDLVRSATCEGVDVPGQDNVLVALELAERDLLLVLVYQHEFRCGVA